MSFAKPVNAAGVPADWPLTLFVARASSSNKAEEKRETLSNSLEYTEHRYARTYGDYHESLSSRVIMVQQKSNKPLPPTGHAVTEIREVLAAARQAQRPLRVICNGFDGLTTNMVSFVKLFEDSPDVSIAQISKSRNLIQISPGSHHSDHISWNAAQIS